MQKMVLYVLSLWSKTVHCRETKHKHLEGINSRGLFGNLDKKILDPSLFLYGRNSCVVYIPMTLPSCLYIIFSNINWAADLTINKTYLAKDTKTLAECRAGNDTKLFKSRNQA